jgi:hypothetical protein
VLQLELLNPPLPVSDMAGELNSVSKVLGFMFAGNATFTIRSRKSGTRYTYKVRKADKLPNCPWLTTWFVNLLCGPDNSNDFAYLGTIKLDDRQKNVPLADARHYSHGKASRVNATAPSAQAFMWLYRNLQTGVLPDSVEVWHEGRCGRCGRKLTVPESVSRGIGPECAERGM